MTLEEALASLEHAIKVEEVTGAKIVQISPDVANTILEALRSNT